MKVHIIFYFPKESDVKVTDIRYAVNTVMECPTSVYSILKFINHHLRRNSHLHFRQPQQEHLWIPYQAHR